MSTRLTVPSAKSGDVRPRLINRLRAALVPVLTEGNWNQIEDDHRRVGLPWREDLKPRWGKPKYVERVLDDVQDDEVIALARRALEQFPERCAFDVEDALLWIDSDGIQRITEVTRLSISNTLEGRRLHPRESPSEVLDRFARSSSWYRFEYSVDGALLATETNPFALFDAETSSQPSTKSNHLDLLDSYKFREWPDARLFRFMEYLVHPTVRRGDEQTSLVEALNGVLAADRFELAENGQISGHSVFKIRPANVGVAGRPKNLIFASTGPKPELGFIDAVNNDIVILRHAEHCLIYDEPIGELGLRWSSLVEWWAARRRLDPAATSTRKSLADRLLMSLGSEPERRLFIAYFKVFRPRLADELPALVPQVYLHYDPVALRELRARGEQRRFEVQRMDFLLLLPHGVRVVLEIDGQQHYATGVEPFAKPSPEEYARTVRGDRQLRLAGYEVYRFGGYEMRDESTCSSSVEEFFRRLFRRHQVSPRRVQGQVADEF